MTRRAWLLADDPAGMGTVMITARADPRYLLITSASPKPSVTLQGLCRGPDPRQTTESRTRSFREAQIPTGPGSSKIGQG